ncbi:MAG: MFS transporter [Bacteroidota bacterium]
MDDAPAPDPTVVATLESPEAGDPGGPGRKSPWRWVPSLYFAQGLPNIIVLALAVILYKRLGMSNTDIALYTSWLYLPWVIKPFWSPLVDVLKTKRWWIIAMQVLVGGGLAGIALTIPTAAWIQGTLAFFWLLAFSSATYDIAADGFYMLALDEGDQAWYVGIRSTFFRFAVIAAQGLVPMLAGGLEASTGLGAIDVPVQAVTASEEALPLPAPPGTEADSLAATDAGTEIRSGDGALQLIATNRAAEVPLALRTPDDVAALVEAVHAQNRAAGFYPAEDAAEAAAATDDAPSWWARTVSGPLGEAIAVLFGEPEPEVTATAGNVGLVTFRLSAPPEAGEEVAVNFGFEDGDQSVKLVEGERFTFTEANWDRPFTAVVQLDPKLQEPTAASFRATSGNIPLAWSISFFVLAGAFLALMAWHVFALPRPASDVPQGEGGGAGGVVGYVLFLVAFIPTLLVILVPMMLWGLVFPRRSGPWGSVFGLLPGSGTPFAQTIVSFFQKPEIGIAVAFIVFYRFAEAQLVKLASPFLLDSIEAGGLGLTTGEVGFVYGTVGVASLTVGGILGGIVAARDGLKRWLWPMVLAINAPNVVYLLLAVFEPQSFVLINVAVMVEQFGYGFGFSALLLYAIYVADGPNKTAHYAIATGLWALGMMIPGMFSGWLQEIVGYERFFVWVLIATIPSFLVAARVSIDPEFGKKQPEAA